VVSGVVRSFLIVGGLKAQCLRRSSMSAVGAHSMFQ
jgi:hypothetical protein